VGGKEWFVVGEEAQDIKLIVEEIIRYSRMADKDEEGKINEEKKCFFNEWLNHIIR
jgi:hypothetical protein